MHFHIQPVKILGRGTLHLLRINHMVDYAVVKHFSVVYTVFPVIKGADIIAKTRIEFTQDQPLHFPWEGYGFKVHIPAGAISGGPVTLCIQASLSGDYQLPDDDDYDGVVSGVYWLSLHPPVKRFHEKVTPVLCLR